MLRIRRNLRRQATGQRAVEQRFERVARAEDTADPLNAQLPGGDGSQRVLIADHRRTAGEPQTQEDDQQNHQHG